MLTLTVFAGRRGRYCACARRWWLPALAAVTVLMLSGCNGRSDATTAPNLTGNCAKYQPYAGHAGTTVSLSTNIVEPESASMQASWAEFSECTGITIAYEGTQDLEAKLAIRLADGTAPDLAIIPQPGLLRQLVDFGRVIKPPAAAEANVDRYWSPIWKAYGSVDRIFYAAPLSANMKSFVWYSPRDFALAGYEPPRTWDQLMALSETIASSGDGKPWCGGLESGDATGWPATDWLEQIVLRQHGPEVYDLWIDHIIPFESAEITASMELLAEWMQNPEWVNGGIGDVRSIATTEYQDAGKPILDGDCWMLQQASFYRAQWPKGTKIGPDGDVFVFYLPPMDDEVATPIIGGGEFLAAFSDRPEVQAFQTYLSSPDWANTRIKAAPGWVTANQGVDESLYADPVDALSGQLLTDPEATIRFDASDLMPATVGADQEWVSMTKWFAEDRPIETVAAEIDAAWPDEGSR